MRKESLRTYQYAQLACTVGCTTTVTVFVVGCTVTVEVATTVTVSVKPNCVKVNFEPS